MLLGRALRLTSYARWHGQLLKNRDHKLCLSVRSYPPPACDALPQTFYHAVPSSFGVMLLTGLCNMPCSTAR